MADDNSKDDKQIDPDWLDSDHAPEYMQKFLNAIGTKGRALSVEEIKKLALERPITLKDIEHLISVYPFLDICNADIANPPPDSAPVKIVQARSLWLIHDRGDRLTAGPGRLNFGGFRPMRYDDKGNPIIDDDDEGGSGVIRPEGTLVKQLFDTAIDMISLIDGRWPAVNIIMGYRPMQRAAWMAATEAGLAINYAPSSDDLMTYETIKSNGGFKALVKGRGLRPG